jgi:hypothetical protein
MDETGIAIFLSLLGVLGLVIWWFAWQYKRVRLARSTWPHAEATIQSGDVERVDSVRGMPINLPVFAFSYQVGGEYYSGRFSLSFLLDPPEKMIQRLVGQKLQVHYDPANPATYLIHAETIEGCQVEQRMGAHLTHLYPKN